jgi:protein-S-isoprenylcysteine O-methyltransferase Ste14
MRALTFYVPVVSVLAIYLSRILELRAKRATIKGQVRETWTLRAFVLIGSGCVILGIAEYFWRDTGVEWWTFSAGWLCAAISIWLRRSAIAALGRFWSLHIEIRESHEFVRSGPFRWVRHPTYLSMVLELASVGLILNAWITALAVILCFVPILIIRVRVEEAALVEKFGEAYRDYARHTPALFPWRKTAKT